MRVRQAPETSSMDDELNAEESRNGEADMSKEIAVSCVAAIWVGICHAGHVASPAARSETTPRAQLFAESNHTPTNTSTMQSTCKMTCSFEKEVAVSSADAETNLRA
jgi:hypothetical protein